MKQGKGLWATIQEKQTTILKPLTAKTIEKAFRDIERAGKIRDRDKKTGKFKEGWISRNPNQYLTMYVSEDYMNRFDKAMKEQYEWDLQKQLTDNESDSQDNW